MTTAAHSKVPHFKRTAAAYIAVRRKDDCASPIAGRRCVTLRFRDRHFIGSVPVDSPEIVVVTGISTLESDACPDLAPYKMGDLTIQEMGSETLHRIALTLTDLTTINEMSASF
jgi:hypothetical protein